MTKSTITRERIAQIANPDAWVKCTHEEVQELARMAMAAMDSEPVRSPVLAYADSYRDMAKQGVESVPIWSVITDLERNIAPLYRHAQPTPEYPEVLPCSVLLEPGLRFGKGIKTSTMLAALARRAVHESDMAALSPEERVEFQARIDDFKALIAQPAPVVPEKCPAEIRGLIASHSDALFNDDDAQEIWNACRAAMHQVGNSPAQSDCCPAQNHVSPEQNSVAPAQSPIDHGYRPECECSGCKATARICAELSANSSANPDCWCRTCRPVTLNDMRFVVCPDCGNKRCPRANDHRNACTGSNEPGQEGSAYPDTLREVK